MRQITVAVDGIDLTPKMLAALLASSLRQQGTATSIQIGQGMRVNGIPEGTILVTTR